MGGSRGNAQGGSSSLVYENSGGGPTQNPVVRGSRSTAPNIISGAPNTLDMPVQPHLKAQANMANGGIGVSYSNVVLAGGLNPRDHPRPNFNSNVNMTTA